MTEFNPEVGESSESELLCDRMGLHAAKWVQIHTVLI